MPGIEKELRLRDGRRLSLWEGGDPTGRPVIFFHGCPDSRRAAISGHDAAAAAGARLVAASRPGYSASDLPEHAQPTGDEHVDVAHDTAELADRLGIGRFAVLGMSVGGPYAVATAALHPDRVRAAGVVEAPADVSGLGPAGHRDDLDDAARAFFRSLATTPAGAAAERMRPEFEAYVAGIAPADPDDAAVAARWLSALPPADAALVGAGGSSEVARAAREALARTDGYLRDAAVSFRPWQFDIGGVRCPVHAWYGDGDHTYSPRNGEWYAEALGATRTLLPGASHLGTLLQHWPDILTALAAPP